jgi:negative regulator of flagellin synthesis FlgM
MKITNGIGYEANKYIDKTTANKKPEVNKTSIQSKGSASKSDAVVKLSQTSKEIQIAQKVIEETPDIRIKKVGAIKTQVNNNTYKVEYDKVAEKILGTMIDELV